MDSDHVEVIKSNKGHYKIIHKGFMYTKHKSFNNVTRWRCAARGLCRGSIMTSNDFTQPTPKMAHTHPADYKACEVAKARYLIPKVNNFVFKKEHFQCGESGDSFTQTNMEILPSVVRQEPNIGGVRYLRKDGSEVILVNEAPTHFMDILPSGVLQQAPTGIFLRLAIDFIETLCSHLYMTQDNSEKTQQATSSASDCSPEEIGEEPEFLPKTDPQVMIRP